MVLGTVVMTNRTLLTIAEDEIVATVEETAIRIKEECGKN
jgi:hypothetical protein